MELLLLAENDDLEDENRSLKKLLKEQIIQNQIFKINIYFESSEITKGEFIRNKEAYVVGIILSSTDKSYTFKHEDFDVIKSIYEYYGLTYSTIINLELNKIYQDIGEIDPEYEFPIVPIEGDYNRIIGIKYGKFLERKSTCTVDVANSILRYLKRPEIKEPKCQCNIF